jgi:hypothetical protein
MDRITRNIAKAVRDFDHLFTTARLAEIDKAIAELDAGQGLTAEQSNAELARRRAEWLQNNAR